MHTVIIKIGPKGEVIIEVNGVKGASCHEVTKALEEALGKVVSSDDTGEAFESEVTNDVVARN